MIHFCNNFHAMVSHMCPSLTVLFGLVLFFTFILSIIDITLCFRYGHVAGGSRHLVLQLRRRGRLLRCRRCSVQLVEPRRHSNDVSSHWIFSSFPLPRSVSRSYRFPLIKKKEKKGKRVHVYSHLYKLFVYAGRNGVSGLTAVRALLGIPISLQKEGMRSS
jgi:hypothetical protein